MAPPSSQPSGFVSPYEIMYSLRSAGFDPLAPPLREGPTYVARAADDRGILVRVVLDARTGAIRDVTQIVAGPGTYGREPGAYGGGPGPYGDEPGTYGDGAGTYGGRAYGAVGMPPSPYGEPPEFDASEEPLGAEEGAPRSALPSPHPVGRATVAILPPLPRPRPAPAPAVLASSHPSDAAKPQPASSDVAVAKPDPKPAAADQKPDAKPDVTSTVAPATPVPAKPGKAPVGPPIND
jgi:hypothetical protein